MWGLGLVVVVGAALVGRGVDGEAVVVAPSAPAQGVVGPTPSGARPFSERVPLDRWVTVIVLDAPARTALPIATQEIVVRGHLLHDTAFLQVVFQSRSAGVILLQTIRPMTVPVGNDRSEGTAFVATLPLPEPRPSGAATLEIVAYDAFGKARDSVVRPIQIGPFLDPTYGGMAGRPPTGEDGLMGGITFGTNLVPHDAGS